jgi:hypothetical protein
MTDATDKKDAPLPLTKEVEVYKAAVARDDKFMADRKNRLHAIYERAAADCEALDKFFLAHRHLLPVLHKGRDPDTGPENQAADKYWEYLFKLANAPGRTTPTLTKEFLRQFVEQEYSPSPVVRVGTTNYSPRDVLMNVSRLAAEFRVGLKTQYAEETKGYSSLASHPLPATMETLIDDTAQLEMLSERVRKDLKEAATILAAKREAPVEHITDRVMAHAERFEQEECNRVRARVKDGFETAVQQAKQRLARPGVS